MSDAPAVAGSGIQIAAEDLHPAMVGKRYEAQLHASGGTGDYQWSVVTGAMPAGLVLDDLGNISGKPRGEGVARFTVEVADAQEQSSQQAFSLTVSPKLTITSDLSRDLNLPAPPDDFIADLHAEGGFGRRPYDWGSVRGSEPPDGIDLQSDGRIRGTPGPGVRGTTRLTVQCTDEAGYSAMADFFIKVGRPKPWRRRRSGGDPQVSGLSVTVSSSLRGLLFHASNYLALLGIALPAFGAVWIVVYAVATPGGSTLGYLGTGLLTAFAAFLVGGLGGFLFGIPRLVSSGQLRQTKGLEYSPSSNLAEVSDWLTKLLLGAGLVQLTRLGAPIGSLIDHVAHGLYTFPASQDAAQVMAGAILFGYTAIGLLDGYVMTTTWYQSWIVRHAR